MTDFELMKAILEKAECDEYIYFAQDGSEIDIPFTCTFVFHPDGEIEQVVTGGQG